MNIKRYFTENSLALLAVVCIFPATGAAATIFTFSSSAPYQTNGSFVSGSGAAETVTINYTNLQVNINGTVTNYAGAYVETYSNSSGIFSITGTNSISLIINEAPNLLGTFTGNSASLYSGVTAVNFNAAFLGELGLAANPALAAITSAAFGVSANGTGTGSVSSAIGTLTIEPTVPEPSSVILLGIGCLAGASFLTRGKLRRSLRS